MIDSCTISTGFPSVDYSIGGFRKGELIVISGRPAMGKTNFGLRMLMNSTSDCNGCFISLELSLNQIIKRIRKQNYQRLESIVEDRAVQTNESAKVGFGNASATVVHTTRLSISGLKELMIDILQSKQPPSYFVLDYLGLMKTRSDGLLFGDNIDELKSVLLELKDVALSLNVCIIVLTQVSRGIERPPFRGLPNNRLSTNLKDSLDMLIYLYRWDYYGLDFDELEIREVQKGEGKAIILESNREVNDWEPLYHDGVDLD